MLLGRREGFALQVVVMPGRNIFSTITFPNRFIGPFLEHMIN